MRVMVLVKATEDSEKGEYAGHEEEFAAMGRYNEELLRAGIMLAGEGLTPSSQAKRLDFGDDGGSRVRATGRPESHNLSRHDWRPMEIEALIGLGRLDQAEKALAEMEADLSPAGPPSAMVTAARLRGDLATAAGHHTAAADAFETAWRHAQDLRVPLARAQLEICDGRRLRAAGQLRAAIARLRAARKRLITLGARPYLQASDRELTAAGAPAGAAPAPALPGLTPAEQAVARLVATGRSNRQTATELYISVKTVEFHLRHIFDKLGIRSRKDLFSRIGPL